jgi:O-antigen ligase
MQTSWGSHYLTAYEIFLNNKIFGSGFKSFRVECTKEEYTFDKLNNKYDLQLSRDGCSTHPHNIYFEILAETGLIGFVLFLALFLTTLINPLLRNFKKVNDKQSLIFILSIILTFLFPFRPTGSFTSTVFMTNMFFFIGFYLYFVNKVHKS